MSALATAGNMPALRTRGLGISFGAFRAVNGVNLTLEPGNLNQIVDVEAERRLLATTNASVGVIKQPDIELPLAGGDSIKLSNDNGLRHSGTEPQVDRCW